MIDFKEYLLKSLKTLRRLSRRGSGVSLPATIPYESMRPRAIELDEEHNAKGFYELMLSGPVRCLPKNRYIVTEKQVRILDGKKIPYRSLSLDTI